MTKIEFEKKLADAVMNYRREMGYQSPLSDWANAINSANKAGLRADPNKLAEEVPILATIRDIYLLDRSTDRSNPEFVIRVMALVEEGWESYQRMHGSQVLE